MHKYGLAASVLLGRRGPQQYQFRHDSDKNGHIGTSGLDDGNECYCLHTVEPHNERYHRVVDYVRIHENFVFLIPPDLPDELVARMLWAGATMFIVHCGVGVGFGSRFGIVGI